MNKPEVEREVPDRSNDHFDGDRPADEAPETLTWMQKCFRSRRWFWVGTVIIRIQYFLLRKPYRKSGPW